MTMARVARNLPTGTMRIKQVLTIAAGGFLGGTAAAVALLGIPVKNLFSSLLCSRIPYGPEIDQVLAVEAKRVRALLNADIAALDQITAQDYVHVESNGRRRSRSEFLDGLARSEYRFESFVIDENHVRIVGPVAIVTGCYHNEIRTREGLQPAKYARHIRVYVKDGGRWRNIAHQATQVPDRAP
jgi:ketosteroid isomerase-like protein